MVIFSHFGSVQKTMQAVMILMRWLLWANDTYEFMNCELCELCEWYKNTVQTINMAKNRREKKHKHTPDGKHSFWYFLWALFEIRARMKEMEKKRSNETHESVYAIQWKLKWEFFVRLPLCHACGGEKWRSEKCVSRRRIYEATDKWEEPTDML